MCFVFKFLSFVQCVMSVMLSTAVIKLQEQSVNIVNYEICQQIYIYTCRYKSCTELPAKLSKQKIATKRIEKRVAGWVQQRVVAELAAVCNKLWAGLLSTRHALVA